MSANLSTAFGEIESQSSKDDVSNLSTSSSSSPSSPPRPTPLATAVHEGENSAMYNYLLSTEANHAQPDAPFVGKYKSLRQLLDYSFHSHYSPQRQLLHDEWIQQFIETKIVDGLNVCDTPVDNWMVFTAGSMGAGKGFTLRWLASEGLFPLSAFIVVDPDVIRHLLPETQEYIRRDPDTAGYLTQKEVGYISEVGELNNTLPPS